MCGKSLHSPLPLAIEERMIRGEDNDNLAPQLRIEQSQSTYVIRIRNPHGRAFADSDRGAKPFLVGKLFLRFSPPFRKPRPKVSWQRNVLEISHS
jgi:hypothetical protein